MKKLLSVLLVALLMIGCGEENKAANQNISVVVDPNASSVADGKGASQRPELPSAPDPQADKVPDLDDPKVLERILEEAVESPELGFSGWRRIDHANGKLSSLSQYRAGRLDGLQAGWHENGQKRIRIRKKDGKPDGPWTVWDENGSKIYEFRYNLDATIFRWHENGQKAYQATYAKDRLVETSWHENGQQSSKKNYRSFQRDGTWIEWDQTGKILSEVHWKGGRRWDGKWTLMSGYDDDEYKKRCEIIMKDGSGTWIYYRKNGTVYHRTTYKNGRAVESIFPPSTTPLNPQVLEGDLATVLEGRFSRFSGPYGIEYKSFAELPEEMRTALLEGVKNSIFLKREPKRFDGAREELKRWIPNLWSRLINDIHQREEEDRGILYGESARHEAGLYQLEDAFSSFMSGEIYEGRSLRAVRKAEEDAQKRHLERAIAETKDEMKASVDGRQAIRRAKERGDTKLSLHGRDVTDLTPLAELTELTELDIYETEATDISPLAKLTKLITLKIRRTVLKDITPLASLTNLRELELYGNRQLTDITPLTGLNKLTKLGIYGNPIADLSPLKGLSNLEHLHLQSIKITELTPLAKLTNLTTIEIQNSRETLTDLTQLRGLTNLEHLLLASNQITDLTPLATLTELTNLSLTDNMISNVTPLTELTNLTELDLRNNPIPLDQKAILRKALPNCVIRFGPR